MPTPGRRSSDMSEGTLNSNSNDSAIELFDLSPACGAAKKQDDQCRSVSSYLSMIRLRRSHKSRKFHSLQPLPRKRDMNNAKRPYSLDLAAQPSGSSQQRHISLFGKSERVTPESSLDNLSFISGSSRQNEHNGSDAHLLDPHYRRTSTLRVSAPTTAVSEHFPLDTDLLCAVNHRLSKGIINVDCEAMTPAARSKQGSADKLFEEAFSNAVVCLSSRDSPSSPASGMEPTHTVNAIERGRSLTQSHSLTRDRSQSGQARRLSRSWSLLADCGSPQAHLSDLCFSMSPAFAVSYSTCGGADTNTIKSSKGPSKSEACVANVPTELPSSAPVSGDESKTGTDSRTNSSWSMDSNCSSGDCEGIRRATPSQLMTDQEVGCVLEELCDLDDRPLGHARYIELDVSPSSAATASSGYGSEEAPVITLKLRTRTNTLETSETPKRALPPLGPPPTAELPALPASAGNTKSYSISPVGRPPARSRSVTDMLSRRDSPVIGPRRRAAEERRSPPESKSAYFASACKEQQRPSSSAEQHFPSTATTPTGLPCPPRPPRDPRRPSTGAEGAERPRLLSSASSARSDLPMSARVTPGLQTRLATPAKSQAETGASLAVRDIAAHCSQPHEPRIDASMLGERDPHQLAREREASTTAVHLWRDNVLTLTPAAPVDTTQRVHKIGRGILDRVQNLVALKTGTISQGSACQQQAPSQQQRERWSPVSERTAMLLLRNRSFSEGEQVGPPAPAPFETRLLSRAATTQTAKRNGRPATAGRCREASECERPTWGAEREAPIAVAHRNQKALPQRPSTSHGERKVAGTISSTVRGAAMPPRVVNMQSEAKGAAASMSDTPPFLATIPLTRNKSIKKEKSVPENLRSALGRSSSTRGPSCLASSSSSSWSSLSSRRLTE
ncbi:hypothetical protein BCV69DRAFT_31836 [Microstroma glucosiphilum]|uniref:Uncharacterized protein n=1 Tax=Pseudomicrostroma glucosiphilum TaxID=1684307 RepID=A0A316U379_9BASI|nr:hypothetical protein BCV69DRAFT_31836 [Pseudomicrostroma glucosiphilum]PWN19759.1 hypothetical protein BCV69DRAFT_31836 [Pseudomicrostroma glucosiphilum]